MGHTRDQQAALKVEIAKPEYSAMTDEEIADALNTNPSPDTYAKVEYSDVISYLMVANKWLAIKVSTNDAAEELMDAVQHFKSFDLNKPLVKTKIEATLDALVTATLNNEAYYVTSFTVNAATAAANCAKQFVPRWGGKFKIGVRNLTGVAFAATGNTVEGRRHGYASQ